MAVDHEVPEVLPHVFYELAEHFGIGTMVEGREICCGDLSALNANELRTLLLGSAALRTHIYAAFPLDVADLNELNFELDASCSAKPSCRDADLKAFWRDLSEHMRDGDSPWTVLEENGMFDDYTLCTHCRDAVETRLREYRENLWPRLPELFKLVSRNLHTYQYHEPLTKPLSERVRCSRQLATKRRMIRPVLSFCCATRCPMLHA